MQTATRGRSAGLSLIQWPERFDPSRTPVHERNELAMAAAQEAVWAWLIRAADWPAWYPNSHEVRIEDGTRRDLSAGVRFTWRTFGVSLESRVEEFVPPARVAWTALGLGVDVYHAWLIEPRPGGCWVLTEETQYGWAARLGHFLMPSRMHRGHQIWLEKLAERAAGGHSASAAGPT
ncbi:MAG: SRPBCC family protein [Thermoanaerobaculia bacterium]